MILRGCIYTHLTYLKKIRMEENSYFNQQIQPISIREKITVILQRQGYNTDLFYYIYLQGKNQQEDYSLASTWDSSRQGPLIVMARWRASFHYNRSLPLHSLFGTFGAGGGNHTWLAGLVPGPLAFPVPVPSWVFWWGDFQAVVLLCLAWHLGLVAEYLPFGVSEEMVLRG